MPCKSADILMINIFKLILCINHEFLTKFENLLVI